MSIFLQNYVQIAQGAKIKPLQPIIHGGLTLMTGDVFSVSLSYMQIIIMVLTLVLMIGFSWLIAANPLGRAQRACQPDRVMGSMLAVNTARTLPLTRV